MINTSDQPACWNVGVMFLLIVLLCGCSALLPVKSPPLTLFSFDSPQPMIQATATPLAKRTAPTLIVSIPRASAGFDSQRMIYVRQANTFEYFSQAQWVETPASMLSPLIVTALERSGQFSAVMQSPTSAASQLRLDVEIVRLQQEFLKMPSQAHFTLRAHLLDTSTREVVAWREFDAIVPSSNEDAYGGVLAANKAIRIVIEELVLFCGQTAGNAPKSVAPEIKASRH